jgi:hypothetical protein
MQISQIEESTPGNRVVEKGTTTRSEIGKGILLVLLTLRMIMSSWRPT